MGRFVERFICICFVVFVFWAVLKLLKILTWSWFWITFPLWGGCIFVTVILVIAIVIAIMQDLKNE